MPTVQVPAGARIYMESVIGSSQAITSITKADPGVVDYTGGTDPTEGDYIALTDMVGMTELEDALVKVENVDTGNDTFEMQDQNTTGYGTFSTGNMAVVTLGTEIRVASGFEMSGGEQEFAEYSYLWDRIKRQHPTTQTAVSVSLPAIWDPTDPGMIALRQKSDTSEKTGFKIVLPTGVEILFYGYVGASGLPNAQDTGSIITTNLTIALATKPRYVFP